MTNTTDAPAMTLRNRVRLLLFRCLPAHGLSRLTFRLSRIQSRLCQPVIRLFIRAFGVNMAEAAEPDPRAYTSINAFFTRALRPGVRPLEGEAHTRVSPVDGRFSEHGPIQAGRIFQAKGIDYSLTRLVGGEETDAEPFFNGGFVTIYLAPGDYHRIHMPQSGRLRRMVHVPGSLYSVAPWTVDSVSGLFARNERVVALFDTASGPLGIVLVGAINVAAIETVWAGLVTPPSGRQITRVDYPSKRAPELARGAEMGRFNLGSTVILLWGDEPVWHDRVRAGSKVQLGQSLERF